MPIALATGVVLLIGYSLKVLVDESMGRWAEGFHQAGEGLIWLSLALGAIHGLKAAWESVRQLKPNIDVLMVVGAGLGAAIGHPEEGALLLFMFTLAGALEHRALAKAKDAVARLSKLMPDAALRREGGAWVEVRTESLAAGDLVLVRPGETIPADGRVVRGESTVDQSHITGESLPRAVEPGDEVWAGTLNQNGAIEAEIVRPVAESSLKRILDLVIEAQAQRQPMQRLIDTFSTPYTLSVFAFAIGVFVYLLLVPGAEGAALSLDQAAYRAITLLIVASPCALVIATPTATLCGLNRAARAGLLVKGGDALERLSSICTIAMDKTGTLTTGRIEVTEAVPVMDDRNGVDDLLPIALAMEERSTHPIAAAIVRYAQSRGARPATLESFTMAAGQGIEAASGGEPAFVGTIEYVAQRIDPALRERAEEAVRRIREEGGISAVFASRGQAVVFALADTPRAGAERLVERLRRVGIRKVVMLTGDHEVIAKRLAAKLGIDAVYAKLLPEEKVERLRELRQEMKRRGRCGLAVVGDGVNDAPALAISDVGLAMGGIGADAALETADVVILNDDLAVLPWAFALAKRVRRTMLINLIFALSVILVLAVSAVAGWIPMGVGVIGHEGSTLVVVGISLLLLGYRGPNGE